jgi:alpha-tubulin suppressor-like RCC1 family protein
MPKTVTSLKPMHLLLAAAALACAWLALPTAASRADIGGAKTHKVAAGHISGGARFSCAIVGDGDVRCWGRGDNAELGLDSTADIGDDETPDSVGPIDLGAKAKAISSGFYHTCAIDQNSDLRCWGANYDGALGYGDTEAIGDDETPASAGTVDLDGLSVKSLATGGYHTCVVLDNGRLRCWGQGSQGQLGYGKKGNIWDAAKAGNVNVGKGRTVKAVAAGGFHTCAILDNGKVRCWGLANFGQTGHATKKTIGDDETPAASPYVDLGKGRKAVAITAGYLHTCALLDNGSVRCWGRGSSGQTGHASKATVGDNEKVAQVPPVRLGKGQKAVAISAVGQHTCAILKKGGKVLCWGTGKYGQLGYGNETKIGDDESPGSVGAVKLGGKAVAIQAGGRHTCAVYSQGKVRCWGLNTNGQLGYGNKTQIGDNEKPDQAGPVQLGGTVSG